MPQSVVDAERQWWRWSPSARHSWGTRRMAGRRSWRSRCQYAHPERGQERNRIALLVPFHLIHLFFSQPHAVHFVDHRFQVELFLIGRFNKNESRTNQNDNLIFWTLYYLHDEYEVHIMPTMNKRNDKTLDRMRFLFLVHSLVVADRRTAANQKPINSVSWMRLARQDVALESDVQTSSNLIRLQAPSWTCDSVNVCATLIRNSCRMSINFHRFSINEHENIWLTLSVHYRGIFTALELGRVVDTAQETVFGTAMRNTHTDFFIFSNLRRSRLGGWGYYEIYELLYVVWWYRTGNKEKKGSRSMRPYKNPFPFFSTNSKVSI